MIVLIGHFRLPADNVEAARAPITSVVSATRLEAGCVKYAYAEDPDDAGLFHVSEVWTDKASLDAHFASAHMKQWQADRQVLGMLDREITAYTTSSAEKL
ncbi:MAG: antibiotic biosynthesis monooxygenase [Burkholderiales bacterium]|nr:MAG: antibiotic biosynthesis monooxygenase [Burkholderiales bacterium]